MKTVREYALATETSESEVTMPEGAKVLAVRVVDGNVFLYALVNTAADDVQRRFRVAANDEELPFDATPGYQFMGSAIYLATTVLRGEPDEVVHVFDVTPLS